MDCWAYGCHTVGYWYNPNRKNDIRVNITSHIYPTLTLHILHRKRDFIQGRVDLVPADEFIQCATLQQPKGTTFRPHKHIVRDHRNEAYIPQEAWVVIRGTVQVTYYDIDDTVLHTDVLEAGDVSITLEGGHNYLFMSDDALVYEFKTGPYLGQERDKIFI